MSQVRIPDHADADRAALEAILGAHFMLERASRWTVHALRAALVPSFVLWLHSRHPLPGLLSWFGELIWAACAVLTVLFTVAAVKWGRALEEELPATRRVMRLRFVRDAVAPSLSSAFLLVALVVSGGLWVHAALPTLLSPAAVALFQRSWIGLGLAGATARGFESFLQSTT